MNLGTSLVLAFLLTSPSHAWAQPAEGGTGAKSAAGAKSAQGDTAKKRAPRKGAKGKEQETSGVSPAARSLARRTKSVFIYAAESCARAPDTCDSTLRDDAETRFLGACGACNTTQRCEAERDAVRAGTARASQDPCAP
jgi:hypothetical protein